MNIRIIQDNSRTEQFGSNGADIIQKLYELAINPNNSLTLEGHVRSSYAYGNQVDFLNTNYNPDFVVDADNRYIPFTDNAVLNILKNTIGDGTGVTETQFSNLTNLTTLGFTNNTSITDFREGVLLDNRDIRIDMGFINGCTNLDVMGIPPYLTYYGPSTTANCSPSKIVISNWANWVASTFGNGNALCNRDNHDLCTLNEDGSLTVVKNVTLPQGCDFADQRVMCGKFYKSSVEEVTLPTSVTRIADFQYSKIRTVNFPQDSGLTKIFVCCFYECSDLVLDVATLPQSITDIGQLAFYGCPGITGILNLPNLSSLGDCAFRGCTNLTKIANLGNITYVPKESFYGCSGITEVSNLGQITEFKTDAFRNCTNLTKLVFPTTFRKFGQNSIINTKIQEAILPYGYEGVDGQSQILRANTGTYCRYVQFPSTTTFVGTYDIFRDSGNNIDCRIIVQAITPPTVGWDSTNGFRGGRPNLGRWYVPDASVNSYKAATGWSQFSNSIYPISQLETDSPTYWSIYQANKDYGVPSQS